MKNSGAGIIEVFLFVLLLFFSMACGRQQEEVKKISQVLTNRDSIAEEMQRTLDEELARWYPASIDRKNGGFLSDFNYAWEPDGIQNKMIVTQARHVWTASTAAIFYTANHSFGYVAAHGVAFLKSRMWDAEYGGFYDLVDQGGTPFASKEPLIKTAYGNAFAIYGLSAYFKASGDTAALRLAQDAFRWMEKHSYDPRYDGYFQFMARDGKPFVDGYGGIPPKVCNSLMHMLESYTELYRVWRDPLVRERLFSLLCILRDTVTEEKGRLLLYFKRDWTQAGPGKNHEFDHISFGHDVEAAYLMIEASEALSLQNDTTTLRIAKKMVDHALANGMDAVHGGMYDRGLYADGGEHASIVKNTKEWWVQVEALYAFLMMSDLFPNDEHRYYEKFCAQWNYCTNYLIDHEHGGWYWGGTDIVPDNTHSPKGSIWKCNYHTSRALMNCIARLRNSDRIYMPRSF